MGLSAERVSDHETADEMRRTYAETGWVVCPHTAVGLAAARRSRHVDGPVVTLSTAHAAKFPETVKQVLGLDVGLPDRAHEFTSKPEKFDTGPMSADFVRQRVDAIGVAEPVSFLVDAEGASAARNAEIARALQAEFDLTPTGIIRQLDLLRLIYYPTAAYGHFGRDDLALPWENAANGGARP